MPIAKREIKKEKALEVTAVLAALGDPLRLRIVRMLEEEGDRTCGTFSIDMPKSSLSHHFKVLRDSGVIESWKSGTQTWNRLRRPELDRQFPGLLDSVLKTKPRK